VKRFLLAMLILGTLLLGVIVAQTDVGEVARRLEQVGPWALAAIFGAFLLGHLCLAASWLLTLPRLPITPRWLWRIWRVLLVGSALESVTPLAGLGGDPVKAVLLKRHYGVGYTEGAASLLLTRMTDLTAQILFISVGLLVMFQHGVLPLGYRLTAAAGLTLFVVLIAGFLLVQTQRGFSRLRGWLERSALGRRIAARAVHALDAVHEVEDQLVRFYRGERRRFALSVVCAFSEWSGNALAVWIAVNALGYPISFADALVIEAFTALVRSTFFFVPGDIGTQEAAQVLICGAITGSPETGLALAAIRRARDLLWIFGGLAIGGFYSLRRVRALEAVAEAAASAAEVGDRAREPAALQAGLTSRSSRLSR